MHDVLNNNYYLIAMNFIILFILYAGKQDCCSAASKSI